MLTFSYKTRNTLVLLGFLAAILTIGGYFVVYLYPANIQNQKAEIMRLQQEIATMDGVELQLSQVEQQINFEQEKLTNLRKQIVSQVTPASSYAYLNAITRFSGFFQYDMGFKGQNQLTTYGYNLYNIRGEGSFHNLYKFIWYLERGPQIYRIKKLSLRGVESKDPETEAAQFIVPFELEVWALFAKVQDLPPIKRKLEDIRCPAVANPFYPIVFKEVPGNSNQLIETERAELKAVIPEKAFIADHTGKVQVLREGDEVYLGYCTRIDAANGQVEFTLNKGGIVEKYILKLRFENAISEY